MPSFVAISRTVAQIYCDLTVPEMAVVRHFGFLKLPNFNGHRLRTSKPPR